MNSWFDGIRIDEIAFYEDFMQEQPLLFVDGIFYLKDGTISEQQLEKRITDKLIAERVRNGIYQKTASLISLLKARCFCDRFDSVPDEINVQWYDQIRRLLLICQKVLPKQTECELQS